MARIYRAFIFHLSLPGTIFASKSLNIIESNELMNKLHILDGITSIKCWDKRHSIIHIMLPSLLAVLSANWAQCQSSDRIQMKMQIATSSPSGQTQTNAQNQILTRDEAIRLALMQASAFQQAQLSEQVAAEDVRQAQMAFLPRLANASSVIYNSPLRGLPPGAAREPSFIAANGISEYEALMGVTGDLDLAGRLRATLRRARSLLEGARAGTEAARRTLIQATAEAYYGLSLATARRQSSELGLAAAEEFERITSLLVNGGEVAQVDLLRARLQTTARRDELEQARATESVAADGLRALIGGDFNLPLTVIDLSTALPAPDELTGFGADAIIQRPEIIAFNAQRHAAELDVALARAERRPQLTYNISGGFDSDSLHTDPLHQHTGILATINLTIPIFDWGASKSRERQAKQRLQLLDASRTLALRGFSQQFSAARAQAVSAATRVNLTNAAIPDATRNVELSIARYRAGEAQIIEVTDAQNSLVAQRAALYQAIFDYQVALTRLRQATGQ